MSGPLYVPVLPARPHAVGACRRLSRSVREVVRPLWNLPPLPGGTPEQVAAMVGKYVGPASAATGRGGWVDAPFGEGAQTLALADAMAKYSEFGPLSPVTGPERVQAQQAAAMATARRSPRGLGVRVPVRAEWDGRLAEGVRRLLDLSGPDLPVDLLLDMGAVRGDRPDAGKEALRALDALVPLAEWRSAALLGGSFPQVTAAMLETGSCEEPRAEWGMWHEVHATGRAYAPRLGYGDYGVQPPAALARPPAPGRKGGPPWGVLSYTTENSYLLFRTVTGGPDRTAVNRGVARRIVGHPEFRGAEAGEGEAWLTDCSAGPLSTGQGVGGATEWLRAGNLQHMTYVVRSLPAA
ncbi:beta family protein [Streptomyces albidoflavus]